MELSFGVPFKITYHYIIKELCGGAQGDGHKDTSSS
jgi:hypothetical protein